MIKELGVQLYTVRDYLKDADFADLTFQKLRALGYTEAQSAGDPAFGEALFGELLQKHGIKLVGTHFNYQRMLNDPEGTMATHRLWNTEVIGLGAMPGAARNDTEGLRAFIKDMNRAAELYGKEGFRMSYHNHNFEFFRVDGFKTIMDILVEEFDPRISFCLDTCWVAAGGADPVAWLEKLKGRVEILHLKDLYLKKEDGKYLPWMAEVGYGNLAWDKILPAAEATGVKHYVVEQDAAWHDTPFDSLAMSAEFLKPYRA